MTIGIDAHNLEGKRTGVGRYLLNLLKNWADFPSENIKFILYFHKEIPQDDFLNNPVFEKKLLNLPFKKSSFLFYFLFLLPFFMRKDRIDVAFFPSYMVPPTFFGKSVLVLHDVAFFAHPDWFPIRYRMPYQIFSYFGAKKSKKIITVSQFSKQEIIKYYKQNPQKILVTPLGVDERFRPINDELLFDETKERYGIKKHFILSLGQVFYRRHVLETISAFKNVADDLPDFQFLIIGKNWLKESLRDIVKKINLELGRDAIIWKEFASDNDLVLLYNSASLSIYLSDYEGFGLPPLEAMACGTPVLSTNQGSLKEVAGDCAIIIRNTGDIEEISKGIVHGITDSILREELIKKGLANVKNYSWKECAIKTLQIIQNC